MKAILFNARSICNKFPEIQVLVSSYEYDLVFITETWATENLLDSSIIQLLDYNIFRMDRDRSTKGGGVLVLSKRYLILSQINILDLLYVEETIVFDLRLDTSKVSKVCFNI